VIGPRSPSRDVGQPESATGDRKTGIARVILDGNVINGRVRYVCPHGMPQTTLFTLPGLAAGEEPYVDDRSDRVEETCFRTGAFIILDAFDTAP